MAFGWDDAFLLAMTAGGAAISFYDAGTKMDLIRQGRELEQAALASNLEAIRAESAESSLEAIKELRQNVGSQVAINAARGVSSGAGSASVATSDSEANFAHDEKLRRLNLLVKENELRAADVLSGIHTLTSETNVGQSLTNQIFNRLPISGLVNKFKNAEGKKVLKSEIPSISGAFGKRAGFGLTPV